MTTSKREFFDKHVFIHTHIEKCGGSTLLRHLTTLLNQNHVYDLRKVRPKKEKKLLNRYPEIKKNAPNIRLLSGHIWYNTPLTTVFSNTKKWGNQLFSPEIFPCYRKQTLYIASIRHPIDRLNSFFRYLKSNPTHLEYSDHLENINFDQFIQELILKNSLKTKNAFCMQITRCRDSANLLEKAKYAFDNNYLAIVPYNKTHELANMIAEALDLPTVENCVVNSNTSAEKIIPSKETVELLEERCSDDIKLYNYICKGYTEKLIKAKIHLQGLLNKR